jgi:hypothetical protein
MSTHSSSFSFRWLRLAFLLVIGVDFCLIGLRLVFSPAFFSMPDSLGYVVAPAVLLAAYGATGLVLLAKRSEAGRSAVRIGSRLGILTGVLWMINLAMETFATLATPLAALISSAFFVTAFLLWGLAGFLTARETRSLGYGLAAAVWSAMLTVLMTVTFGFLLMDVALPHLASQEITDPDFVRSQWNSVTLFAIANTLNAGFSHLLEAPIIALVFGLMGSGLGRLTTRRQSLAHIASS